MAYAIISVGGKQYRVSEGETLLVDRLRAGEGDAFTPRVLFAGGDGEPQLSPEGVTVTARVVGHVLGDKIRIGKYRAKTGYRRHTGYRSRLSRIEIESIATGRRKKAAPAKEAAAAKEAPAKEAPPRAEEPAAAPEAPTDYEGLKVAEVTDWAKGRHLPTLERALEYERATAARKGAIAALETAIAKREEG